MTTEERRGRIQADLQDLVQTRDHLHRQMEATQAQILRAEGALMLLAEIEREEPPAKPEKPRKEKADVIPAP